MSIRYLLTIMTLAFMHPALALSNITDSPTANYLASIQNDPEKLLEFLQNMPKGGDLHYHAGSGGAMAENIIQYGYGQNFCVDRATFVVSQDKNCLPQNKLDNAPSDQAFYNAIINSWSMRNFHPITESGHDHFFAAFGKMDAVASKHDAETIAETVNRAGNQNESYLELMLIPDGNASGMLGKKVGWNPDLTALRTTLLANGLPAIVTHMQAYMDGVEAKEKTIMACGTAQAKQGCKVKVNYLYEALREQPPAQVFAQLLAAFELAKNDPRFVGINLVQPEDGYISMRDYHLQMQMIHYLHSVYPQVHISLHAGELNSTLVPPEGLRFHIREAIEVADAERIGHGVDTVYEANAKQLLKEMAAKHIMVEINLSSNEAILNSQGKDHPLPLYLEYHVPVALSTDDEGIIRTTLTLEYQKAILRYHLPYDLLKNMVRNSIYYSFAPGENLWKDANYNHVANECAHDSLGANTVSPTCRAFLQRNQKANLQWDLENRFNVFESQYKLSRSI